MLQMPRFRAFAALSLVVLVNAVASAEPISLVTPAGLNPGDHFRFAFVTNGSWSNSPQAGAINALSGSIAVYNAFVTSQAYGATFGSSTVSWKAIGSTATTNARDNVGGYGDLVPVYLVDGTRVANSLTTNAGGFWSGSLLVPTAIHLAVDGTNVSPGDVWTGTRNDGTAETGYTLGSGSGTTVTGAGNVTGSFLNWGTGSQIIGPFTKYAPMFAMSETLTVAGAVPEIDPAGMGSVLALVTGALALVERRRASRVVKA